MLRTAIAGVLFLPALVLAQEPVRVDKPVICGPTESVLKEIVQFGELPLWGSQLEESRIALFTNPETQTWTIIQWTKDVACVIEVGEKYFLKDPKNPLDERRFKGV